MSSRTETSPERDWNWDEHLQQDANSDIGMRRLNNQDYYARVIAPDLKAWRERGHFFMVADGMGAHAAGELASKLAVEGVRHLYYKYAELSPPDALQRALVETNGEIHRRGQANPDFHNMGTTASALLLLPQGALVAHIGDSRVYRLRNGRVEQITRDHSLVWELRDQLAENSELSIPKNVITRSLGPNPTVQVDIEGPLPLQAGDSFLPCSDGLTGRVSDEELGAILQWMEPRDAVHLLTDLANLRGGPDNITVLVAKITSDQLATVETQPLKIGARQGPPRVQPALWVCIGVCVLGALLLAVAGSYLPALLAAFGALVSLLVILVSRQRHVSSGLELGKGRRLGKGPYTETKSHSLTQTVAILRDLAQELRSSNEETKSVDWSQFDAYCRAGEQDEADARLMDAFWNYSRAIRCLMQKVRDQQNRHASDSTVDY